jgi:transaldolase
VPNPLAGLTNLGQSIWYDYIRRDLMESGELRRMIDEDSLRGMTSNPTIFQKAIAESSLYDGDIRASRDEDPARVFEDLAVRDVRSACDVFLPAYKQTGGVDGYVSIEVDPTLAFDTAGTIAAARRLWKSVDRPNAMIKIPGTKAGLSAIETCLAEGISVNVTLLFAVERYREVMGAWFAAMERRASKSLPLAPVASVASFFVSRVDTLADAKINSLPLKGGLPSEGARRATTLDPAKRGGEGGGSALKGKLGIANAKLAYAAFEELFRTPRFAALERKGARVQRPLWASTSTKNPAYPDTYYVDALLGPDTVNTLPPETFAAYKDHGRPLSRLRDGLEEARGQVAAFAKLGLSLNAVTEELEKDGVKKFADSYASLLKTVSEKRQAIGVR